MTTTETGSEQAPLPPEHLPAGATSEPVPAEQPPASAPPAEQPAGLAPEARSELLRRLGGTLEVIGALGGPDDVGPEVDRLRALLSAASSEASPATDEALLSLRAEVLELDASLTHAWFRPRFEARTFPLEQLEAYAALRATSLGGAPRRERLELLAVRLLAPRQPDGRLELLEPAEAINLLARILPARASVEPERVTASVLWLDGASLRVLSYATLDQLLGDRFFLDLFGFKCSLRDEVLDPAVLQAAARLHVAISTRIVGLCQASGLAPAQFDERIEQLRLEAFRLLNQPPEPPQTFQRRQPAEAPPKAPATTWQEGGGVSASRRWANRLRAAAGVAILLLLGLLLAQELQPGRIEALGADKLANLSSLLVEGSVSRQPAGLVLVGRFSDRWRALAPKARREQAARLRTALGRDGIRSALIFEGQSVALQLERGRIVMMQ